MWYIIKTDYYKEREAIKDLLQLDGITDIYFPNPRPKLPEIGREEESTVSFRPVINGILFAYVTEPKLLRNDLNASGYFLRKEKTANIGGVNLTTDANGASVNRRRMQVAGNAHLFSQEGEPGNLESLLLHAQVSDEEIYRYKVCVEQCAAHTDDIKIVDKDYAELAAKNDLVMITDGPLVGYTGVIKQVKTDGVKDRCFFFSLGGFCVRLSGIRRYGVIVVRESAEGTKAQLPNTWRYIDFLQGKLQASYFADNSSFALRNILEQYNKVKDIERCQSLLLSEARGKATEAESREMALQAVWLQQADHDEVAALKSLGRFFQSTDDSVAYGLEDLIPDMPLRPFLTPTPGMPLPKGSDYTLFPHNGFVELIVRVNLKQEFLKAEHYPSMAMRDKHGGRYTEDGKLKGKMRKARPFQLSPQEYIYYAHVGLRDREDGTGMTAMVNWGEFAHRYLSLGDEGRATFLQDLSAKGYHETHHLLTEGRMHDESPSLSGFVCHIPRVTVKEVQAQYEKSRKTKRLPVSLLRTFVPVRQMVRSCIPSAVEFWQRQRLLEWRHLVQRYVLLHNLPLRIINGKQSL